MSAAAPGSLFTRLMLLIVLIAVQIVTPGFATACDIGDALAIDQVAETASPAMADADGPAADPADCCDCLACGDCCLHAPTALPSPPQLPSAAFARVLLPSRSPLVVAAAYPVAIRPPIAR